MKRRGAGTITIGDVGSRVRLQAWVQRRRDLGGLLFLDLRDRSGVVQVVVRPEEQAEIAAILDPVRSEWVVEIEGEVLNPEQVRSSIARRLGMDIAGLVPADRDVEGIVEMMLDATQNYKAVLTAERLFSWHAALFPTGRSGMHKIVEYASAINKRNAHHRVR